jgi:hypothetical protein
MKRVVTMIVAIIFSSLYLLSPCFGAGLTPEQQTKVDAKLKSLQEWGADTKFVVAVKEYNTTPSADAKSMTNEKWKTLTIIDPFVQSLAKNELATYLKTKKDDMVSEIFVSGADGGKVAFLTKTTSWTHKGKEKHDQPIAGKTWQGAVEVDESTGKQQIQVSVPVLDGTTPIGSIVIGLSVMKL